MRFKRLRDHGSKPPIGVTTRHGRHNNVLRRRPGCGVPIAKVQAGVAPPSRRAHRDQGRSSRACRFRDIDGTRQGRHISSASRGHKTVLSICNCSHPSMP